MSILPRITIVTPTLNQVDFIEEAIESVLSQGYPDLEYIVIDGGSTDGTLKVLAKYEGCLRWISEPDHGQSEAINKGLRMATGQVVAFLNSDDRYEPGALLKVGSFFAAHPEADWLTGLCRTVDTHGLEIRRPITLYKNTWLRLKSYGVLLVLNYISQPATFWTRTVVEQVGYFDETLHYAMDYDYFLRVGRRFKLFVLDAYLAHFRLHPQSKAGASAHAQFDAQMLIARRYVKSPVVMWLHSRHRTLTVVIYRVLAALSPHRPCSRLNANKGKCDGERVASSSTQA